MKVSLNWLEEYVNITASPAELATYDFAAGSMGPKVEAACDFVRETGKRAAIGSLADIEAIVAGQAGTIVENK